MPTALAKVIAATVIFISLLATVVVLVHEKAPSEVLVPVAALLGAAGAAFVPWIVGKNDDTTSKGGGAAAVLLAAGAALAGSASCAAVTPQNIENAAAVTQYEVLLTDCRKRGKEAKSYEVYEACADALDHQLCVESRVRCVDGGAK